jgi:oligopeptide transport system substrate-binding protein
MLNPRRLFPLILLVACAGALAWAVSFGNLPPADFTFVNGTEVQSLDQAIVTGQPEGRIINALFEGLYHPMPDPADPHKLRPTPGAAESCDISDDAKTYTFHMRPTAKWSNGDPVTAHDFVWSWRRTMHPETASEYAYQLHYIRGAAKFNLQELEIGDRVEVELADRPDENQLFPSGTMHAGVLKEIQKPPEPEIDKKISEAERKRIEDDWRDRWTYVVEVYNPAGEPGTIRWDGPAKVQRFSRKPSDKTTQRSLWILPHFGEVGAKAVDDRTLVVELNSPTPYFLDLVAFYPLYPVNRRCVEAYGFPEWTKPGKIVGNGAFTLEMRRIGDRIRLRKNPLYWDADNVELEIVDALAVESEATQLNMYMNFQTDWATTVPTAMIPELRQRPDFRSTAEMTTYFYRVNIERPPLDDHRVRAALNMAIDKRMIVEYVTRAGQQPARSFVPPGMVGYTGAECSDFNMQEAKRLLAEAGYPNGRNMPKVEILFNTLEAHRDIAEVIQQQWKQLGVDVELKNVAWGVYLDFVTQQKYEIARAGWIGDYPDPNTFLDMFVTDGPNNNTGWSNKLYDDLIAGAKVEPDAARRMEMFHDAEAILMDNWEAVKDAQLKANLAAMRAANPKVGGLPVMPIYFRVSLNMVRTYVKGVPPYDKFGTGFFPNLQDIHPLHIIRIDEAEKQRALRGEVAP